MSRCYRVTLFCLVAIALALPARAEDKTGAQEHFEIGISLLKVEDFKGAAAEFERSIALYPTKMGYFNLANCLMALHRYDEALNTLIRLREKYGSELDDEMIRVVNEMEKEIRSLVAEVVLRLEPEGTEIIVDGKPRGQSPIEDPLLLGPGEHQISASHEGYNTANRTIRLVSGDRKSIEITLDPEQPEPPPPPPPPAVQTVAPKPERSAVMSHPEESPARLSPLFWVGLASTVAVGATAGVFWGLNSSSRDDFQNAKESYEELSTDQTSEEERLWKTMKEAKDDALLYRNVAIAATSVAGALALGTIAVLIYNLNDPERAQVELAASPGGLTICF